MYTAIMHASCNHLHPTGLAVVVITVWHVATMQPALDAAIARTQPVEQPSPQPIRARSLLGQPLQAPAIAAERRATMEAELAAAIADHDAEPTSELAIIWLGRRLAYLHRYDEAIKTYSDGLTHHPDSPRLLRHRGHRYITLRDFAAAERDLARAADLVRDTPDEVEPDGQPNSAGIPTSTLQSNIHYHLGLVRYLSGDFHQALNAYRDCQRVSSINNDMMIATTYWHYLTLRRLGRDDDASALLGPITPELTLIENHDYHRLLLMFKGVVSPDDARAAVAGSVSQATVAYGIALRHYLSGDTTAATTEFRQIVSGDLWPAFGHIAAEAELARQTAMTR